MAFEWKNYRDDPISVLYIWKGGIAIYGGVIGAVLGVLFVKRAPQKFFEAVVEVIVIVSAVKLLWPSSPVNTPEPVPEQTEETAPAEILPSEQETADAG